MNGAISGSVTASAQARLLLAALKVENRMRLSPEGQAAFAAAEEKDDDDWMEAASRMQFQSLKEVGLAPTARNVALLRATALEHPEIALYVRHNRCRKGELQVGDSAPQGVELYDLDGGKASFPLLVEKKVQVFFAGSVT